MFKVCNVDLGKSGEIYSGIEAYCRVVAEKFKPYTIILFGSFAEGSINEGSDVDLLIIADFKEDFLDRIKVLLELNRFNLPLEPVGYTPTEFLKMFKSGNRFIHEIVGKGKILYGKIPNLQ